MIAASSNRHAVLELMRLGLTEYEAKTYYALVELGQATAVEVARRADVPRNRVYEILEELSNHGLAQMVLGDTRAYAPLPFGAFLERRIQELERGAETLKSDKERILTLVRPREGADTVVDPGTIRVIRGSYANDVLLSELVQKATRRIRAALTAGSASRVLGDSEVRRALEDARARGVDVRIVVPVTTENADGLEKLAESLGDTVRAARQSLLHIARVTTDQRDLYLRQPALDEARSRSEVGFLTDSPILVADAEHYVEQLWESGTPLPERIQEIRTGLPTEWEEATRDVARGTSFLVDAIRSARRETLVMTDTTNEYPPGEIERITAALTEASQRGVKFRLITRITPENAHLFPLDKPSIVEVRHLDRPDFRFQIVDATHLYELIAANPDGTGLAVMSTIRAKVAGFRSFFEEKWEQSVPLKERLQALADARSEP